VEKEKSMPDKRISFEIKEHLGVIQKMNSGWCKELNIVSWNGNAPKYDIREWDEHHEKMSKGITLNSWEMQKLTDMYLKNNTDKAVAKGRAIEEERKMRAKQARVEFERTTPTYSGPFVEENSGDASDEECLSTACTEECSLPEECNLPAECTAAQVAEDHSVHFEGGEDADDGTPF